jgi:hypothetical protein
MRQHNTRFWFSVLDPDLNKDSLLLGSPEHDPLKYYMDPDLLFFNIIDGKSFYGFCWDIIWKYRAEPTTSGSSFARLAQMLHYP